jgi:hypothetical protein
MQIVLTLDESMLLAEVLEQSIDDWDMDKITEINLAKCILEKIIQKTEQE